MSVPRFHVPGAAPGARVHLTEHTAHHARDVLRLRAGAGVRIFDGRGAEFEAVLESMTRSAVTAHLGAAVTPRPESNLRLVLAVSALKGDHMEVVIQKATELGVAAIRPLVSARTDAVGRPALQGSRQERWEKVASGAAEQCGRAVVPEIEATSRLDALLAAPFDGARILFLETPGQPSLTTLPRSQAALALVGPAGGWEPWEAELLRGAGFHPVSLGPRILRAETAALAAVTALQLLWGDLG